MNAVWSAGLQRKPPIFLGRVSGRRCLQGLGAGRQRGPGSVLAWRGPDCGQMGVSWAGETGGCCICSRMTQRLGCVGITLPQVCPEWLVLAWGATFLQFPFHRGQPCPGPSPIFSTGFSLSSWEVGCWDTLVPYLRSLQSGWLGLSRPKQDPRGPWALYLSLRHHLALNPLCGVYHRPQEL